MQTTGKFYDKLYLSKNERLGIALLLLVLLCVVLIPLLWRGRMKIEEYNLKSSPGKIEQELTGIPEISNHENPLQSKSKHLQPLPSNEYNNIPNQLFEFDPNHLTKQDAINLGISEKTYEILQNYLEKAGMISSAEQFSRIYGISPALFKKLEKYIRFQHITAVSAKQSPYSKKAIESIDINEASVEDWSKLPGIGPVLSDRIIRYKNKLGGFYHVDQLIEVYGLAPETHEQIKQYLKCNQRITPLDLRDKSIKEIASHPYLDYKSAKLIYAFLKQHPDISSTTELNQIFGLDHATIKKIGPYLSWNNKDTLSE